MHDGARGSKKKSSLSCSLISIEIFAEGDCAESYSAYCVQEKSCRSNEKSCSCNFCPREKKNNPKPEFWIDRKKVAAATFFPRAKVAAATFVGATQTCSHFGLPTWTIGGTCVLLYTETGHFRSQPKECLKLMSTMLDTLKRKHLVRKKPTVLSTTLLSTTSTLLKLKKKLRPGGPAPDTMHLNCASLACRVVLLVAASAHSFATCSLTILISVPGRHLLASSLPPNLVK